MGSTPHSKRMCRLRLCGRAYELPQRLHVYAPPVVVVGIRCDDKRFAAMAAVPLALPPPPPLLLPPENMGSGTFVMLDGGVMGDVTDDDESSRKLIEGVNKRKSHGWSSGVGGVVLLPGFFTRDRLPPPVYINIYFDYSIKNHHHYVIIFKKMSEARKSKD